MPILNMVYYVAEGGGGGWDNLDISTAVSSKQFNTGAGFQGLYINPQENIALTSAFGGTIKKYNYSNIDISTATADGSMSSGLQAHSIRANKIGTHIYVGNHGYANPGSGGVHEYSTTNWSTSMSAYKTKTLGHIVQTVWVNSDETYMVVGGGPNLNSNAIYLYSLTTPGDVSSASLVKSITVSKNYHGIIFNDEMTKCIACEYNASSGTVYQYDRDILHSDTMTQTHTLGPVGFTVGYPNINEDATRMYLVNESGYIYQYTLS